VGLLHDTNEALAERDDQRFRGIWEIAGTKKPGTSTGLKALFHVTFPQVANVSPPVWNSPLSGDHNYNMLSNAGPDSILKPLGNAGSGAGSPIIVIIIDEIIRVATNDNSHLLNFKNLLFKSCNRYFCHFKTPFMRGRVLSISAKTSMA
jgi:hypothetical protein